MLGVQKKMLPNLPKFCFGRGHGQNGPLCPWPLLLESIGYKTNIKIIFLSPYSTVSRREGSVGEIYF